MPKFRTLTDKPVRPIENTTFTHILGTKWIETGLSVDHFKEVIYVGKNQAGDEIFIGISIKGEPNMILKGHKGDEFN